MVADGRPPVGLVGEIRHVGADMELRRPRADGGAWECELAQAGLAARAAAERALDWCLGFELGPAMARTGEPGPRSGVLPRRLVEWLDGPTRLDQVLTTIDCEPPRVRVERNGAPVEDPMLFQRRGGPPAVTRIRSHRLADQLWSGATVIVNGLHQYDRRVGELHELVRFVTGCEGTINAYISVNGPSTLGGHWDPHDVVALQLAGSKRWTMSEPDEVEPLGPGQSVGEMTGEIVEDDLTAGRSLFMPRGWIHRTRSSGNLSVHYTIAMRRPTWRDDVLEALASSPAPPTWRSDVESGSSGGAEGAVASLGGLLTADALQAVQLRRRAVRQRDVLTPPLAQLTGDPSAGFVRMVGVDDLLMSGPGQIVLGGFVLQIHDAGREVVAALADRRWHSIGELMACLPEYGEDRSAAVAQLVSTLSGLGLADHRVVAGGPPWDDA